MTSSYSELLKHPKWQKKRLEVLERAGFKCEDCGEKEETLHVHHGYYESGKMPWDYDSNSLHCLCEECHKVAHELKTDIYRWLGRISFSHLEMVLGYIKAANVKELVDDDSDSKWKIELKSYEMGLGMDDFFRYERGTSVSDASKQGGFFAYPRPGECLESEQ